MYIQKYMVEKTKGYMAYDAVRLFEDIPGNTVNDLKTDDFIMFLVENLIIFDHFSHSIFFVSLIDCKKNETYLKKCEEIVDFLIQLLDKVTLTNNDLSAKPEHGCLSVTSNMEREEFKEKVIAAKEYIARGDIFQIVLSQRFSVRIEKDSFTIYRVLRRLNPSPYMFYFQFEDTILLGSSPEVLVKCENGRVITRPLAGTRRRGVNCFENKEKIKELLNDEKERAEHVMLVDLGRNDLGKVCRYGSVKVGEFMDIEQYSHVMHIVSKVTGELRGEYNMFDVFKSCFPAGTVSGAPKIRAMKIIDELEPTRRGTYAGAVGYFDFHNTMDTCIAIRTMVIKNGTAYVQAGAGIVADSDPDQEYYETINKAQALIKSIATAEGKTCDFDYR